MEENIYNNNDFWVWLRESKGITKREYIKLSQSAIMELTEEYHLLEDDLK